MLVETSFIIMGQASVCTFVYSRLVSYGSRIGPSSIEQLGIVFGPSKI